MATKNKPAAKKAAKKRPPAKSSVKSTPRPSKAVKKSSPSDEAEAVVVSLLEKLSPQALEKIFIAVKNSGGNDNRLRTLVEEPVNTTSAGTKAPKVAAEPKNIGLLKERVGNIINSGRTWRDGVNAMIPSLNALGMNFSPLPDFEVDLSCTLMGQLNQLADTIQQQANISHEIAKELSTFS